jgi:hypothetical protein
MAKAGESRRKQETPKIYFIYAILMKFCMIDFRSAECDEYLFI